MKNGKTSQTAGCSCTRDGSAECSTGGVYASPPPDDNAAAKTPSGDQDGIGALAADAADSLAELKNRVGSLEEALLRGKADFANLQRRSANEKAEAIRFANAELLRSILHVLDDFDRTIEAADKADDAKVVVVGVRLVHANLWKSLGQFGLESIEATGRMFDPSIHEALLQQPAAEHPPGTVLTQVSRGYRLHDRVLRPARVIVAGAPAADSGAAADC